MVKFAPKKSGIMASGKDSLINLGFHNLVCKLSFDVYDFLCIEGGSEITLQKTNMDWEPREHWYAICTFLAALL